MQEVCLWKDILVGKEVTPRHCIAWRLTRNWVSCLSSRQLWAKPFPPHHQFRPRSCSFFFFWSIVSCLNTCQKIVCFYSYYISQFIVQFFISQSDTPVKWVCYSLICHGSLDKENYQRRIQLKKTQMNLIGWPQNSLRQQIKITTAIFFLAAVNLVSASFDVFLCWKSGIY